MYKLVRGTHKDMDDLLKLGRAFYAASGYEELGMPYDEESQRQHAAHVLDTGLVVVARVEGTNEAVGMIGILLHPFHLNTNIRMATEVVWWVEPEHRRSDLGPALVKFAKDYAKRKGAKWHAMTTLANTPKGVDAFLTSEGMTPVETAWIGGL